MREVTDGWSLRALRQMLRVSTPRLSYLIGNGILRVRDPRISASSLAAFCDKNRHLLDPSAVERVAAALAKGEEGYTWERAADLLGVTVAQVQSWISAGQTESSLTHLLPTGRLRSSARSTATEINMTLIDPATAKWLVSEYGVSQSATNGRSVSRVQKHALVIRACQCGRKIAGNAYFRHVRTCQSAAAASTQISQPSFEGPVVGVDGALASRSVNGEVNIRIGISAPVLKRGVRTWQF